MAGALELVDVYIEARRGWELRPDGLVLTTTRPINPEEHAVVYRARIPIPLNHGGPVHPVGVSELEQLEQEVPRENGIGV